MDYPFTVPGYEHVPLVVRTRFLAPVILFQGAPLEKIPGRKFRLAFADGSELVLGFKPGGFNFIPKVTHGDQVIEIAPPMPVYQQVLVYLPLVLIFVGGAIGGLCGGLAAGINVAILRGSLPAPVKILLALLTAFGAAVVWLILGVLFTLALRH